MHHNLWYKKGQFILLIVCTVINGLDFLLFILGFIFLLGLNLLYKQSSDRNLIMKHSKKNESNVTSQKRCFSTSNSFRNDEIEDKSSKPSARRKTLKSPQARPYEDLYKGRGKPKYEPEWVKDNGMERSPFGAS